METTTGTKLHSSLPKATLIIGVVIAFAFPLLMSILVAALPVNYWVKVYSSRLIFWAEVLLLWMYARKVEKQNLLIWPEKRRGLAFIISAIVSLYLLTFGAQLLSAIPALMGYKENNAVLKIIAATVRGRPFLIVLISFTAGFCEEVIFRGYMLTRLSILFKNQTAGIIVSSLLFAGLHYKYNTPREYIFPFLIGVIFSLHYQKFGNIKPLIIVHFLIDVVGLALASHYLK